jgi:hypothetical protein
LNSNLGLKYVQELAELPTELWYDVSFMFGDHAHERYDRFKLIGERYILFLDAEPAEKTGNNSQIKSSYHLKKNMLYIIFSFYELFFILVFVVYFVCVYWSRPIIDYFFDIYCILSPRTNILSSLLTNVFI